MNKSTDNSAKRQRKRKSSAGNTSATASTLNTTASSTHTPKLFFHSKGAAGSSTTSNNSHSHHSVSKNNSRLSLSPTKSATKSTHVVSPKQLLNASPNKKFKLHQTKSSSSENLNDLSSANESNSDDEDKLKKSSKVSKKKEMNNSINMAVPAESVPSDVADVSVTTTTAKRGRKSGAVAPPKPKPVSTRVSRNTKVNSATPKIMATGIVLSDKEKQIVANLGGQIVTDCHECTHLVTNKIRKTYKFLSCLSRGAHILNERWLEESNKSKMFLSK